MDETDDKEKFFPCLPYGFKSTFDMSGWISSTGPKDDGKVTMVKDLEIKSSAAEIVSMGRYEETSVSFPDESQYIGTELPWLNLHFKNLQRFVAFTVEIEDDQGETRVFRTSNAQSVVRVTANTCNMPLELKLGWNKIEIDLAALTTRVFRTAYKHTNRICVYANCRLRRVYFSDRKYLDSEVPPSLRVFPEADPLNASFGPIDLP